MELDEQLQSIATGAPDGWWEVPVVVPEPGHDLDAIVECLLLQFFYFHVHIHIHLPYLADKHATPILQQNVSRLASMDASRQLLRRYIFLRSDAHGVSLFDCLTSDFVAFTAAVVLLIGNSQSNEHLDEDLQLIGSMKLVLSKIETQYKSKMISQCLDAMELLSGSQDNGTQYHARPDALVQMQIPYFGTILRRSRPAVASTNTSSHIPSQSISKQISDQALQDHNTEYSIDLSDYSFELVSDTVTDNATWWEDAMLWDIDQDWDLLSSSHSES
jgi:hypothetical protein